MANVTVKQMKPMHLFVPFTTIERDDKGCLTVEGICYGTAKVGDGYNLKSKTMKRLTPDYMKFGAVRAMHQPIAAGTALSATWEKDKDGNEVCRLSSKAVDADTIKKIEEGVYKGYSVGVIPTVVRGEDVDDGKWVETSYVDRPWDEKAVFTSISRASEFERVDLDKSTFPVIIERAKAKPEEFPGDISDPEQLTRAFEIVEAETDPELRRVKMKKLRKAVSKIAKVKAALNAGSLYYIAQPTLTRGDNSMNNGNGSGNGSGNGTGDGIDWRQRALAADGREQAALQRNQELEEKLRKKGRKLDRAETELEILRRTPAAPQPVRFPNGAERTFEANGFETGDLPHFGNDPYAVPQAHIDQTIARYRKLTTIDGTTLTEAQQKQTAHEVAVLSEQLSNMGVDPTTIF